MAVLRPKTCTSFLLLSILFTIFGCIADCSASSDGSTGGDVYASSPKPVNCTNSTYPSLADATSDQLATGLNSGCFSSVDLVNAYVARINEVNSTLHTVLQINPDAHDIAANLDSERKAGKLRGPLHGLPVLLKGNIGTKDELKTAAGSIALEAAQVAADSTVAAKLRENGVIILGKSSLSEWANFRSMNSSEGWNPEGGQTYGAYYPKQDPSGSSSGSGVATDLGLAVAALGTETDGSVLSPSEVNNLVGIKPTVGLTSRYMVIPISEHQDSIGSMARTVKDAARLLQVIAGKDRNDNYTLASPFNTTTTTTTTTTTGSNSNNTSSDIPNYEAACKLSGLEGKRIGIPRNAVYSKSSGILAPVLSAFESAIPVLSAAGATIVDNTNFTSWEALQTSPVPSMVNFADFISSLESYLSNLKTNPNNLHNLQDVRTFTQQNPREDYPSEDTGIWDAALLLGLNNTSPEFWPLYQHNLHFGDQGGVLGAIVRQNLDAVILPTDISSTVASVVGSPVITVPLGAYPNGTAVQHDSRGELIKIAPGIPFGISFLGQKWSEEKLIEMAYAFEQRTNTRGKLRHYIEPHAELKDVL